jgi:hypothetical protein
LILAIDEKVDQQSRTWELVDWILKGGVAFEYVPWIPNATIEPVAQFSENNELMFTDHSTNNLFPRVNAIKPFRLVRHRSSLRCWRKSNRSEM